ncbi:MAG: hypothetical protein AB1665_08915 [Candidatus Thermoplasmatota archaeon]
MRKGAAAAWAVLGTGALLIILGMAYGTVRISAPGMEIDVTSLTLPHSESRAPASCIHDGRVYIAYERASVNGIDIMVAEIAEGKVVDEDVASAHTGDNKNPFLLSWAGALCLLWDTKDPLTQGMDRDIALRTFDGVRWSDVMDLSSSSSGESSEDSSPRGVSVGPELHVVWESGTSVLHRIVRPGGAGQQYEIGTGWGPDIDALNGVVYAAWTTYPATGTSVLLREYQDEAWMDEVVSLNPNQDALDYSPSMEAFQGRLYIAWVTKDKEISAGTGDDDVVVRSYDPSRGALTEPLAWSPVVDLSSSEEDWDGWPFLRARSNALVAVWQTWDLETNDGNQGDDLVMRSLVQDWGEMRGAVETARQCGDIYEQGFSAVSHGDGLYIFFQSREHKRSGSDWEVWMASWRTVTYEGEALNPYALGSIFTGSALAVGALAFLAKLRGRRG